MTLERCLEQYKRWLGSPENNSLTPIDGYQDGWRDALKYREDNKDLFDAQDSMEPITAALEDCGFPYKFNLEIESNHEGGVNLRLDAYGVPHELEMFVESALYDIVREGGNGSCMISVHEGGKR